VLRNSRSPSRSRSCVGFRGADVTPMLCGRVIKGGGRHDTSKKEKFHILRRFRARMLSAGLGGYEWALDKVLIAHKDDDA